MATPTIFNPLRSLRLLPALLCALAAVPAMAEPLRLTASVDTPYFMPDKSGFLDRLIPEVFRRIGIQAEAVQYKASARANINANEGIDDGVAMRVKGLDKNFPNLIRVDEKVIDNEFVAYSLHKHFATTGFDTLRPFQIAYITGWKVFDDAVLPNTSVTKVKDADQLFTLLGNERTDIILFERWQGNSLMAQRGLPARMLEPALVSTEMFMYLHKKHAALAEPAAQALRTMKADGSYQRIYQQALPPLRAR